VIDIRPGRADDVAHLDRLLRLLADTLGDLGDHRSTVETLRRDGFGAEPLFRFLLAWPVTEISGRETPPAIGACVYLADYSTSRGSAGVYILDLVVTPEWRGTGVGLELLGAAAAQGRERWNADYLILAVDRANEAAHRFYRRHGFSVDEKSNVMTLDGIDRLLPPSRH
jgi:ribosomal protein S18 acetylase RimI-like enzyme